MKRNEYLPEGMLLNTLRNISLLKNYDTLSKALAEGVILEARCVLCDENMDLHIDLGFCMGIIPRCECGFSKCGRIKDIAVLSRVGKPVCFKVTDIIPAPDGSKKVLLSRKAAQEECMTEYIERLLPGDVINARMTHFENYGGFADIGCGIISLMSIDCMSVSRISHPTDRFHIGQQIKAVVKRGIDENGYVSLTHRELLGTWEENAASFSVGQTAAGIIRSVESYGVFVELTPNLAGLAEYREDVTAGSYAAVYIKSIIPERMKIKLVIVDIGEKAKSACRYEYPNISRIDRWLYSPLVCDRVIETVF